MKLSTILDDWEQSKLEEAYSKIAGLSRYLQYSAEGTAPQTTLDPL